MKEDYPILKNWSFSALILTHAIDCFWAKREDDRLYFLYHERKLTNGTDCTKVSILK